MAGSRQKNVKGLQTKDVILNAAEEVFAFEGYGGARTAQIAKCAGINKALIHYYYNSKENLYHAVMDRLLFEVVDIAQDVLRRGLKGKKLLDGLLDAFFDYAAKHRHFVRLTTAESAGKQSAYLENTLKNFFRPLFLRAVDFFRTEARAGKIQPVDGEHFVLTMYLAIQSYFSESRFLSVIMGKDATTKDVLAARKRLLKDLAHRALNI